MNVALIGAGRISQFHRKGLLESGAKILWICDLDAVRAKTAAGECPDAKATTEIKEVLDDPTVETVVICTISRHHKGVCLAAIEAGKHVICEKTLTIGEADSREVTLAAHRRGVLLFTGYMKRFFPASRQAVEWLPRLGEIFSTTVRAHHPWGDLWTRIPDNLYRPDGMSQAKYSTGGGMLPQGGSHLLDMTMFLLGRPSRVYASVVTRPGYDFDLQTEALMHIPGKGMVHFSAIAHPYSHSGPLQDGWDEQIIICGTGGQMELNFTFWDHFATKAPRVSFQDAKNGETTVRTFDPVSPFSAADHAFVGWMKRKTQGDMALTAGHDVDCLIDAMIRSSDTGLPVEPKWITF